MIVCPVCEHAQEQGPECEVCGKGLLAVLEVEAPAPRLDGLEPTALAGPVDVAAPLIAELEPTGVAPVQVAAAAPFPDMQPTATAPVEVVLDSVPDVERTPLPGNGDPRTELPLFPVCRYCRTEAAPGEKICGRCGMKLSGLPAAPPPAEVAVRLCSCGTPITRSLCPACGARNATGA